MYLNRFQQGDKVQYCGERLAKDLAGRLGVVHARVQNSEREVVVDFGSDSYILDETTHLTRFQGKEGPARTDGNPNQKQDKKAAGPEVVRRKARKNPDNA